MPSSSTPRTTPVGSIRWRSIFRSFNERSLPRMTFLHWPISNSAFSPFRSITSGRHLPSNGPSHTPICRHFSPNSTADDWLQQPDRKYVTVILNQTTKLRDPRIQASEETIRKSLEGNWRPEHVFTLKQSRNSYRHYQEQIAVCEEEIEKLLVAFQPRVDPEQRPLPPDRKRKQRSRKKKNVNLKTGFDLRTESEKPLGVELTQIPGLKNIILTLFGE